MKIHEMKLLVRVAETGSMTQAAKQLHLTTAAVSATVQRIEDAIGVRVFERSTRFIGPTDEGQIILDGCQRILDAWQQTLDDARGQRSELEGTIHITAPADTSYQIIESVVVDLCTEHPHLRVILNISDAVAHLHRDAIDMAIRYGELSDSALLARRLAYCPGVLVASPAYIAEHGSPEAPEELLEHRCVALHLSSVPHVTWTLEGAEHTRTITVESPLCGDGYLIRKWALTGMGIANKSLFDVIDDLEAGALVRILPDYHTGYHPIHAVFPSRQFLPARVRALDEAIASKFAARAGRCKTWLEQFGEFSAD